MKMTIKLTSKKKWALICLLVNQCPVFQVENGKIQPRKIPKMDLIDELFGFGESEFYNLVKDGGGAKTYEFDYNIFEWGIEMGLFSKTENEMIYDDGVPVCEMTYIYDIDVIKLIEYSNKCYNSIICVPTEIFSERKQKFVIMESIINRAGTLDRNSFVFTNKNFYSSHADSYKSIDLFQTMFKIQQDGYLTINTISITMHDDNYVGWNSTYPWYSFNITLANYLNKNPYDEESKYLKDIKPTIGEIECGRLKFNVDTGSFSLGKTVGFFQPGSQSFIVLVLLVRSSSHKMKYSDLIKALHPKKSIPTKTDKIELSLIVKNIKRKLGILPKNRKQKNKDIFKSHKGYGYELMSD